MNGWQDQLGKIKINNEVGDAVVLKLPNHFIFKNHGVFVFDPIFDFFDWSICNTQVVIDFTQCRTANYQALSLVVLYSWKLKSQGCRITFKLDDNEIGASNIWKNMGASGLFHVSTDEKTNFRHNIYKPLIAIRNTTDFKKAISMAEEYTREFNVEYISTLRHVLSELIYNTQEHGISYFSYKGKQLTTHSLIQFTWYQQRNEIHFIIADIGVGIKNHLSQSYPGIESDIEAIKLAIKPQVSGTFAKSNPYESKNNAGVGLFISTNIIKRLKADMHIISGEGILHVSPRDITSKTLNRKWPGKVVLVSIKLERGADFVFHAMMQEFREAARVELSKGVDIENDERYYISIDNFFGPYAEDKHSAIKIRNEKILPNISDNKIIVVDFDHVKSAPHSFLSALLATPIKRLGMKAYKNIKILNASPEIRETIDYILDENTEEDA